MDIKEIIKSNLPDGIEVGDKTLSIIAKELKSAIGEETVPKSAYSKQSEKIISLESKISEIEGNSADGEAYKTKVGELEAKLKEQETAHKEALKAKETEITELKTGYETEKTTAVKQAILRKQLTTDGANAKLIGLLEKEFDLVKLELDGEKIKDWDKISKPVKEQYADVFGTVETVGAGVANPPAEQQQASYTMEQIKTMTPAQINANWDKGVKQALEKG